MRTCDLYIIDQMLHGPQDKVKTTFSLPEIMFSCIRDLATDSRSRAFIFPLLISALLEDAKVKTIGAKKVTPRSTFVKLNANTMASSGKGDDGFREQAWSRNHARGRYSRS